MGRYLLFLLLSSMLKANGSEETFKVELVIFPTLKSKGNNVIYKKAEETLNLTCSAISDADSLPQYHLHWDLPITPQNSQNRVTLGGGLNTLTLVVQNLKVTDSGDYNCEATLDGGFKIKEAVTVNVKNKKSFSPKTSCNDKMFSCSPGQCIPRRYKCDGHIDCESGADEAKINCGPNACQGRITCDDGRCIPKNWCCDQYNDPNCTVKVKPPCCSQWPKSYMDDNDHAYLSEQQRYSDMGFLQTTIYTVIGCAMAFMFIVTILVVAICRVHMKRTSALASIASVTSPHGMRCPRLTNAGNRFPTALSRNSATHSLLSHHHPINPSSNSPMHSLQIYDLDVYLNAATGIPSGGGRDARQSPNAAHQNPHSLLVTYNINNGVQFVGRPVDPPPYCEVMSAPPREGPPPPYVSHEDISSQGLNQVTSSQVGTSVNPPSSVNAGTALNPPPMPSVSVQQPQQCPEEPSQEDIEPAVVNIESQVTDSLLGPASEERSASGEHRG